MLQINWQPNRKTLRQFGWVALLGFGLLAAVFTWKWPVPYLGGALAALGVFTLLASFVYLPAVRWVYLGLTLITFPIGFVVSHVLLAFVYFVVVTPIGLLLRLAGRDLLDRRIDRAATTYWHARPKARAPASYFSQF